jgi:dolichol kinase
VSRAEEPEEAERRSATHWVRRGVHLLSPLFLGYYWMDSSYAGLPKQFLVILAIFLVLCFEAARLHFRWRIPGMRPYERRRLSAAAMGGVGLAFGLLLLPQNLVMGCFAGMCLVDPLVGELRARKARWRLVAGAVAFAAVFIAVHVLFFPAYPILLVAIFGALAGVVAVYVEEESPWWLDDDLTMHIAPALALLPLGIYARLSLGVP